MNVQWILDNDIDAAELEMYFVVDSEEFGSVTQIELKEVRCAHTAQVGLLFAPNLARAGVTHVVQPDGASPPRGF